MAHWKKFMDKELLGAWDLEGRDVTVTILDVSGAELNNGTKKNKKPVATVGSAKGRKIEKKLALNATNCKVLEQLAGSPDTEKWKGMAVTLFPTTTQFGGETKECIRIRPYHPKGSKEEADRQKREEGARAEAKKYYRQPGDTMELDDNERRWLAEAGRPVSEGSTLGPEDDDVDIINAAARKEGLIDA